MGDMKTPDFDDLLAAFDIPDIDANEAIQSSPEKEQDEMGANSDEGESGSPSCFPRPAASHSDLPVVSVIVKNTVRSESLEEEEEEEEEERPHRHATVLVGELTSPLGAKVPPDDAAEPQIANGIQGSLPRAQGQSKTPHWHPCSPLGSMLDFTRGKSPKGAVVGLVPHAAGVGLKPLPVLQSSIRSGPHTSLSASPHLPRPSPEKDETFLLSNPPSSPLSQNGSFKAGVKHVLHSDEEDSEPDLGSPLVIQESPESVMSSPPKFQYQAQLQSEILGSPEYHPRLVPHRPLPSLAPAVPKPKLEEHGQPTTFSGASAAPRPRSPQDCLAALSAGFASVQEDKYPEHVIDERDSPESPPPSETGLLVPKGCSSPDSAQATANNADLAHKAQLKEEESPGESEKLSEKLALEKEHSNEKSCGAGTEGSGSAGAAKTILAQPHPLKVKIKMPTGSITRTVTGAAPKKSGRAIPKGANGSKPSAERQSTRSKREPPQSSPTPAMAMLQDACAATLEAAGAAKDKTAVDAKLKVSPTAVSITKTAALPTISVSAARVHLGGANPRGPGHKAASSAAAPPPPPPPSPLLTPQISSRPASIVNSTGAIISKTQTNLVEAFNKILNNKNLLPSYKPDLSSPLPAEWGLPLPAQGYRCLECGDAFALSQSLARHYDRRSLRIEVTCNHCAKRLAFYNKCSLLLHAREHKEKGLIMQCSHLVMKPVPVEQMIGHQEPTATGPSSSSSAPAAVARQAVPKKKGEAVHYTSNKCPECQAQFHSKEEVAEHFQEIKPAQTSSCTECTPPMLLPNSCSAAAHKRIHQSSPPRVCPECGGTAKQLQFQKHLDETCLHFARRIGYRCSSCLVVFGGLNSVKSHIQQAHCDMFHKCPSCPMAFKSAPSIQSHISGQHPTLTERQTMLIYKCVMCDTVFTNKSLLHIHFETHLTNQKVHVFKCPECTKLFSQRNSLLDHFKTHKPPPPAASPRPRPPVKLESSKGEEWTNEEKVKPEKLKTPSGWKCAPCHARYTDREDYIAHMAEQHSKSLKKFPCNKCESSFTTTSSMRRHIRDKHKAANRCFRCQFCSEGKKTFSSRAMLERHVQQRHGSEQGSQNTPMGGGDEADSSSEQDSSSGPCPREALKTEPDEEPAEGASPVKKMRSSSSSSSAPGCLPESGFRCSPCGFAAADHALFLEHIGQHRRGGAEGGGGGGQQCLQCGACFTSVSALSRHRFITHKVRDADSQQSAGSHPAPWKHEGKNSLDGSAPASPASLSSAAQGKDEEGALACRVCDKQFEKATDLTTHFRTHGMAFISARNVGKAP